MNNMINDFSINEDQICMIKNENHNLECQTYNLSNNTYQYLNTSHTSNMVNIPASPQSSQTPHPPPSTQLPSLTPEFVPVYMSQISQLVSGLQHHCAYSAVHATHFNKNQFLRCWGDNTYGQLDVAAQLIEQLDASSSLQPGTYTWSADNNKMVHKVIDEVWSGPYNVCVGVGNRMVICWGRGDQGVNQVPDEIKYDKEILEKQDDKSENKTKFDFKLSISLKNACAIRANNHKIDKRIFCWGHDTKSDDSILNIPDDISGHSYDIAVGYDHACTLYSIHELYDFQRNHQGASAESHPESHNHSPEQHRQHPVNFGVRCWGSNHFGQLKVPLEFHAWTDSIIASQQYSCAVNVNQQLGCWGVQTDQGGKFQLPKTVANQTRLVSTGGRHTCMHMGGTVNCIGNNEFGQSDVPVFMENSAQIVETGWDQTCMANLVNPYLKIKYSDMDFDRLEINHDQDDDFVKNNEQNSNDFIKSEKLQKSTYTNNAPSDNYPSIQSHYFSCFGFNQRGQTDFPPAINNHKSSILQASLGLAHSCTLSKTHAHQSALSCWGGLNESGQLEVPPQFAHNVALVSVADEHTCAVSNSHSHQYYSSTNDHSLWQRQGHDHSYPDSDSYTSADTSWHSSSSGSSSAAGSAEPTAIVEFVKCWGSNEIGQTDVPHAIRRNKDVRVLTSGAAHTCTLSQGLEPSHQLLYMSQDMGITNEGTINYVQKRSTEDKQRETTPLKLNLKQLRDYAASITCWGSNSQGQTSIPAQLIADNVIAGTEHTCILTKGTLNCQGGKQRQLSVIKKNIYGELGINNHFINNMKLNLPLSPVSNKINLVSMGYEHDCVVQSMGKPYCWGENEYGQSNLDVLLNNQLNVN